MIETSKNVIRTWAKAERKKFHNSVLDNLILENIKNTNVYKNASNIMLFYPINTEINLLPILSDKKNFSFPIVKENDIYPYKYTSAFKNGKFNIPEPSNSFEIKLSDLELVITPALAADKNGYRIGYGKGFYDRFIKKLDRSKTALLLPIYQDLILKNLPFSLFDEKVDIIISEKEIFYINAAFLPSIPK